MVMLTPVQIIAMTAIATMSIIILIAFEMSILISLLFLHSEIKNIYSIIDKTSESQCDERKSECGTDERKYECGTGCEGIRP